MARLVQVIFILIAGGLIAYGANLYLTENQDTEQSAESELAPNDDIADALKSSVQPEEGAERPDSGTDDAQEDVIEDLLSNRRERGEEGIEDVPETAPAGTEEVQDETDQEQGEDQKSVQEPQHSYSQYIEEDPIPLDRFNLLEDAIFSERVFEYADAMHSSIDNPIVQGREWKEWSTNFLSVVAHIETVRLRFEVRKGHKLKPGQGNSFYVEYTFNERAIINEPRSDRTGGRKIYASTEKSNFQIIARHSKPKSLAQAGGARLLVGFTGKQIRYVLEGNESTSLVLMVPQGPIYGPRGIIMCPRDYELRKARSGVRILEDTGFELVDVDFVVRAVAEGRVSTGFGPGFAEAVIQTTDSIPTQELAYDSSRSIFPFASVEILPAQNKTASNLVRKKEVTGAVKAQITMHNSLNHKSVTEALTRLTVREIDIRNSFSVSLRNANFKANPGVCYSIVKETRLSHSFSKEKLEFENKGAKDKSLEELAEELSQESAPDDLNSN